MHVQTGAIAHFENDEDAKLAGYIPIKTLVKDKAIGPTKLSGIVNELMGMNRHQRRAWMAQKRKAKK
jgi:hypothetical protein